MRTILIVDDSRLARMVVIRLLSTARPQWAVKEADGAETALEAAAETGFDGALIDFNMRGRDGVSLAADLRRLSPSLPIAILTANNQNEVQQRAAALGALFLIKPLQTAALQTFLDLVEGAS